MATLVQPARSGTSQLVRREALDGYLFISPWLIGFVLFAPGGLDELLRNVHLHRLFATVAGNLFAITIQRREVTLQIMRVDNVVRVLEELAVAFLTLAQRR